MATPPIPAKRIETDVDADVLYAGEVQIGGRVGAVSVSGTSVVIEGDVSGAKITSQTSARIVGAFNGQSVGRCIADATITSGPVRDASLMTAGDIVIAGDLVNGRACAGGALRVNGKICGGKLAGNAGIFCDTAGDEAGTPTVLAAGVDLYFQAVVLRRRPEIERDQALATSTHTQCEPLLAKMKELSPTERESVTVTLYEAEQLVQAAGSAVSELREWRKRSADKSKAEINVAGTLFAKVTLRVGGMMAFVPETLRGPLCIRTGMRDGANVILIRNTESDEENALPATPIPDPLASADAFLNAVPAPLGKAG